jgi:hypothetical protein
MLHQETNHQADLLHVWKLHAVSCIDDIEEGVRPLPRDAWHTSPEEAPEFEHTDVVRRMRY